MEKVIENPTLHCRMENGNLKIFSTPDMHEDFSVPLRAERVELEPGAQNSVTLYFWESGNWYFKTNRPYSYALMLCREAEEAAKRGIFSQEKYLAALMEFAQAMDKYMEAAHAQPATTDGYQMIKRLTKNLSETLFFLFK